MDDQDLRPALARAQEWVSGLLADVRPEQLDLPTPCSEFDLRSLIGHVFAVTQRVWRVGHGADPLEIPSVVTELPDDLAEGHRQLAAANDAAWAEDDKLGRRVRVPWGEVTGAEAIAMYLAETLTHGWDLAFATGQPSEAEPELARQALTVAHAAVPEQPRGGPMPFAPVVEPAADAGPTERLANWMGRASRD